MQHSWGHVTAAATAAQQSPACSDISDYAQQTKPWARTQSHHHPCHSPIMQDSHLTTTSYQLVLHRVLLISTLSAQLALCCRRLVPNTYSESHVRLSLHAVYCCHDQLPRLLTRSQRGNQLHQQRSQGVLLLMRHCRLLLQHLDL